jgi:hypothetical protein
MAALQGKDVGKAALSGGIGGAISGGLGAYGDANVFGVGAPPAAPVGDVASVGSSAIPDYSSAAYQNVPPPAAVTTPVPPPVSPTVYPNASGGAPYNVNPAASQKLLSEATLPPMDPYEAQGLMQNAQVPNPVSSLGGSTSYNASASQGLLNEATLPPMDPYEAQGLMQNARDSGTALNSVPKPGVLSGNYYQGLGEGGVDTAQKLGIQALPVMSMLDEQQSLIPTAEDPSRLKRISPNFRAQEAVKPDPYYKAKYAAGGGLMDLRPQTNFADPAQSTMGTSQYDMLTDPMSGNIAQRMASGGSTTKKKRATLTSDRSLAAMDPYEAGLANLNNARYGANMAGITNPSQMTRLGEIPTAAGGGLSHLGGYSDGGRMLKGPGDGMSDNIPAMIGKKQPARLADGEFVVPADVVSHLGNGSTDAGAKRLYAMMDKVRRARTGKKKQAPAVNTRRLMPA